VNDQLYHFFKKTNHYPEFQLFLSTYRRLPAHQFALVRVGHGALQRDGAELAESLAMMQQLGVIPTVILDTKWDSFLDPEQPVASDRTAARRFLPIAQFFIEQLQYLGAHARIANPSIEVKSKISLWDCDPTDILDAFKDGLIPIVSPFGTRSKRKVYLNGTELSRMVLDALSPSKYILITESDGLTDKDDMMVPFLNLSERKEYQHIQADHKSILREIRLQLNRTPDAAAVITHATHLLKEIFTVKGRGTFIKRFAILSTTKLKEVDQVQLTQLIETAFNKRLVEGYFNHKFKTIVYEKHYEGVAIVKMVRGIPYLDKIAVTKAAEGTGLGRTLWNKISEQYPTLVWRSTIVNPMNAFYFRECDGCLKGTRWIVYWRNLPEDAILPMVHHVSHIPPTLR